MKLRMTEADTAFETDDIEPFPRTIADAILRMLAIAEAANPAIDRHEVLLELDYVRRATDRQNQERALKDSFATVVTQDPMSHLRTIAGNAPAPIARRDTRVVPASQVQDPFEDLRPIVVPSPRPQGT